MVDLVLRFVLPQEISDQGKRNTGLFQNRGVTRVRKPRQLRVWNVIGKPLRRLEKTRRIVFSAHDESRRFDATHVLAQVRFGQSVTRQCIARAGAARECGSNVLNSGEICDQEN